MHFGGLPVGPEVDMIMKTIGPLERGQIIPYADIEAAIDRAWNTPRFVTVTTSWRKLQLKEHNLVVVAVPGESFKVLTESERIDHSRNCFRYGARKIKKSWVVGATTDRDALEPGDQARLDHHLRITSKIYESANEALKKPLPETAPIKPLRAVASGEN